MAEGSGAEGFEDREGGNEEMRRTDTVMQTAPTMMLSTRENKMIRRTFVLLALIAFTIGGPSVQAGDVVVKSEFQGTLGREGFGSVTFVRISPLLPICPVLTLIDVDSGTDALKNGGSVRVNTSCAFAIGEITVKTRTKNYCVIAGCPEYQVDSFSWTSSKTSPPLQSGTWTLRERDNGPWGVPEYELVAE